ncbi:hypothetical protein ANCCAN_08324, partial [Ancylostoma caninum]
IAKADPSHTPAETFCGTTEVDNLSKVEKIEDCDRGSVRFMIGSPVTAGMSLMSPEGNAQVHSGPSPADPDFTQPSNGSFNYSSSTAKPFTGSQQRSTNQRKLSMPSHFPATPRGSESRSSQLTDLLKQSFTPKRGTTARGEFSKGTPAAGSTEPMLSSEFVPWCSRIFVQPILDLIYCKEEVEDFTDRALTLVNPTDWAIFVEQGQRQQAHSEFELFKAVPCDSQLVAARIPSCPTAISLSMLRKCIYTTDGDQIYITRYERTHNNLARKFSCTGGNPFNLDKTSSIIVINEVSREMLLCGSSAGIVRIWDPSFNIHSHEIEGLPQLVTASNPLCDQSRLSVPNQGSHLTLYDWSQETGRLICGGNVRVIRVWDAHYERTVQDISIAVKKGAICVLSGELDRDDLIAAGYRDGVVHVHDVRVPGKDSLVMSFSDLSARIVGVAIRIDSNGNAIVAAGDECGGVCVWEPRMIKVRLE